MESVIFREKKIHNIFFRSRVPFKFVKVDETKWKVSLFVSIIPQDIYFAPQGTLFNLKKSKKPKGKRHFSRKNTQQLSIFRSREQFSTGKNWRNQMESVIFRRNIIHITFFYAPGLTFHLKKVDETKWKVSFFEKEKIHNIFFAPGITFQLEKVDETKCKCHFWKKKNPQHIFSL